MASFPMWAAIRTVKSKIGTWVGFDRYRESDPSITRADWATAIGQARAAIANKLGEITRPLNRRPVPGEITPYTSIKAHGYLQWVDVYVRNPITGDVETRPWNVKSETLRSRASIVNLALSRYEAATLPEGTFEGEEVLGASYAGTLQYIPKP